MTIRTIHIGVGGRGVWPLRLMAEREDYESVGLVDIKPDKLATARELTGLGEEACFSSLDDALQAVEADAVVVVTPPDFHAPHCFEAVRAGKHVLVEKPFTKDLGQAHAIVQAAAERDLKVAICQNRRFSPVTQTIHRLVRDRVYGPPSFGAMNTFGWRPGVHHSGTDQHSYLWERGIHDLDALHFMLDARPVRVWGHSFNPSWSPYAGGAGIQAWVEFDGGISFSLLCTFASRTKGSDLRIECEEGTLVLQDGELLLHRPAADEPESVPFDDLLSAGEGALLDGFYRYIREGIEPSFSAPRNLVTVGLVESIGEASDRGEVLDFDAYVASRT